MKFPKENILESTVNEFAHFKQVGHELIELLTQYLEDCKNNAIPTNQWRPPADQLEHWATTTEKGSLLEFFTDVLQHSMHVHHPHYIGHQVAPAAPVGALASLFTSLMSNGMAVYEMGAVSSSLEYILAHEMCGHLGFDTDTSGGFLTSGGTLANLTAILAIRANKTTNNVWQDGYKNPIAVMVSEQAHYCVERAMRTIGMGERGIVSIPVGEDFKMRTDLLASKLEEATQNGIEVLAVVGSAPSTATGIHDDLNAIADFCEHHNLWFHVDAAHGGPAILSARNRELLQGIHRADSVVIDAHKLMRTPSLTTYLLFKEGKHAYSTFRQRADYLLEDSIEDNWYDVGLRTYECTKLMMSVKLAAVIKTYGYQGLGEHIDCLYNNARQFAKAVEARRKLELLLAPESNIVCFRYTNGNPDSNELNTINLQIRRQILHEGKFYIVQTVLNGTVYLRTTFMNPATDHEVTDQLLDVIVEKGDGLFSNPV